MKNVIPENCAPSRKKKTFSCYTNRDLKALKRQYNKTPRKPIKTGAPSEIWRQLMERLQCSKESCIANSLNLKTTNFAPKSPEEWKKNPTTWLSSDEITNVMKQYQRVFPEFLYIGPSPSDFYFMENGKCAWEELCRLNVITLDRRKTKIGIVFNLDVHDGPGTHWVGVFIDRTKKIMYYFDSTGEEIHANISKLYDKIKQQDGAYKLIQNSPTEHQFGNTECGMYTLFFMVIMIQTGKFSLFTSPQTFSDKGMERLRKRFFNE